MKEKIEKKIKETEEHKKKYLNTLNEIDKQKNNITAQVIACNGAIDIMKVLLEEE